MSSNRLQAYYDESCRIRGLIIDETSKLERQMDDFICQSLVGSYNEKINFVKELFIENEVIYIKKVKIAIGLLKRKFKSVSEYNRYHEKLNNDLIEIGKIRNILAHGCTTVPEKIDFAKYKIAVNHKKVKVHLTTEQIQLHLRLIESAKLSFVSHFNWKRLN